MRIVQLDQNSPDWHAWRATGIGSSDAPSVMGNNKYRSRDELFQTKLFEIRKLDSEAASWGHTHEDEARQLYHDLVGIKTRPVCIVHDEYDWLRASLDGLSLDNTIILEIKCPFSSYWSHKTALDGKVPSYYWDQVQHQLLVTGLDTLHYWSYWAHKDKKFGKGQRTALVPVKPDKDYQAELLEAEKRFYADLAARV
jgi:putative phage-type endonuclease